VKKIKDYVSFWMDHYLVQSSMLELRY